MKAKQQKKTIKHIFSILITLALILTVGAGSIVFAAEEETSGQEVSEADTVESLQEVQMSSKFFPVG